MKKSSHHYCNVLETRSESRRLWQFNLTGRQIALASEVKALVSETLPAQLTRKSLLQRRLNIAWLPADQVFLRVIQLPLADSKELASMVEFQLEKLSPIPVNQIVWSIEPLPRRNENSQTVIVIIMARDVVEKFLGQLETGRFLPDRLELPQLHLLLTTPVSEDGVWLFPSVEERQTLCLAAWWCNSTLQQLQLIHLPTGPQAPVALVEQLNKTAWAGEIEGWLTAPARAHLVAEEAVASGWQQTLSEWTGAPTNVTTPVAGQALAELAASRAARGESQANLLPVEFANRYRQQFVDKLWMTGLGAVIGTYIVGVLVYFAVLFVMGWQKDGVEKQVRNLSGSYTNAMKLKEKIDVLQSQLDLKYAALDTFRTVAEKLPESATLTSFNFSRGQKITLAGTAPSDIRTTLTDYVRDLKEVTLDGKTVFKRVDLPITRPGAGQQITWQVNCDIKSATGQ